MSILGDPRVGRATRIVVPVACWLIWFGTAHAESGESQAYECLLRPQTVVRLSSAIEGQIESVLVDRGDRVERDQVVAELESIVERASASLAAERLAFERRRAARGEQMFQRKAISAQQLDETRSGLRVRELELERSEGVVERRLIRSPIAGVVVARHLEPGEFAQPSEVLEIAQLDPLRVECYAPSHLFGRILEGSAAEVTPELDSIGTVEARVTVVDSIIDSASGTFGVRLEIPNADRKIPAGLRGHVRFGDPSETPAAPRP